jgi:hypothetical protein
LLKYFCEKTKTANPTIPVDRWIEQHDARSRAEKHIRDFRKIAEKEHRDALRNRRAFLLASLVSAIVTVVAIVGWVR